MLTNSNNCKAFEKARCKIILLLISYGTPKFMVFLRELQIPTIIILFSLQEDVVPGANKLSMKKFLILNPK